ncbi:MAG: amidohydrolase family protein [Hyphomonas sp.]
MDSAVGNLARGDLLIDGSRIEAVGPSLPAGGANVIDATDMILLPGFVDCHRHGWEAQLRHLNPNSDNLLDYCCGTHLTFARHYRPQDNYVGNLLTAVGAIDAGVTTLVDNCHNARTHGHAAAALQAWLDADVRVIFAPGPPLTSDWDMDSWPGPRLQHLKDILAASGNPFVTLGVMAQFVPEIWALAREMGLPIVAEVPDPQLAPVLRSLDEQGLLGPDVIFNHITGMPADVLEILRRAGVGVNVCPRSDAQYGIGDGGMGTFQAAMDAGLEPAFSIDNETSYGGDMFGEMRTEFFLQRAMTQRDRFSGTENVPAPITVAEVLKAATISGARCCSLDNVTGSLTPGKEADLIAIRLGDRNLHPLNNAFGAVVHGADRTNIDTVIIGGRIRKRNGTIVGLDEAKLRDLVSESRDFLMNAVGYTPDPFCDYHTGLVREFPVPNRFWQ